MDEKIPEVNLQLLVYKMTQAIIKSISFEKWNVFDMVLCAKNYQRAKAIIYLFLNILFSKNRGDIG